MAAKISMLFSIWCGRGAELDVGHGDDGVHKRDGVIGMICSDFIPGKLDNRTVQRVTNE